MFGTDVVAVSFSPMSKLAGRRGSVFVELTLCLSNELWNWLLTWVRLLIYYASQYEHLINTTSTNLLLGFQIPPQEELKSVVDKVKDFFGGVKDSFGSMSSLPATSQDQAAKAPESKDKKWA